MGSVSSDFVDPETLPLQILLSEHQEWKEEDDECEKLRKRNWQLSHEKTFWQNYALFMERNRVSLSLRSPLTKWCEKMYGPDSEGYYWKWYKTNCPCCRRPLEITMSSAQEQPWTRHPRGSGYAFVTALWGANAGYALGALVLGYRLQELSPKIDRVIVHTDDVPANYLRWAQRPFLKSIHDEEATGFKMMNFLAGPCGLRVLPEPEGSHPMWNDFLNCVNYAGLKPVLLKATLLCNWSRGPFSSGTHQGRLVDSAATQL